jgi:hypothetical protein
MPSRRTLLRTVGVSVVPLVGCVGPKGSPGSTEPSIQSNPETTDGTSSSASTPPGTGSFPPIYFSEILPNPEGEDVERLNEEYVLIEMNADEQRDLSNFTLEYNEKHHYSFPALVTEVESGSNLIIRSGDGENRTNGSDYLLFVGSDNPLLDNGGMQLTLRTNHGEVINRVTYGEMEEGTLWARPE